MIKSLIIAVLLINSIPLSSCSNKTAPPAKVVRTTAAPASMETMSRDILSYINQYRKKRGLPALQTNSVIAAQAQGHSRNMATGRVPFSHQGFETRVSNIRKQLGPMKASAENVAYGMLSAKEVVDGWLNSAPHKKNIEGNFSLTGIGVAKNSKGVLFYTQIFALK